jgi:hypothetical protein
MSQKKIYSDLDYQKTSEVTNMLHESEDWLILRSDSKGVLHIHQKKAWESLHLIPLFLYSDNNLYKEVVTIVNKYKK